MNSRMLTRAGVAVSTAVVASMALVSPASATGQASVYYKQVEAGRVNFFLRGNGPGYFIFRVSDTACDAHSVYAQYQRAGASRQTIKSYAGGCRTHSDYYRHFTTGQTIKYRVCVSRPVITDVCGNWKWDTTGG